MGIHNKIAGLDAARVAVDPMRLPYDTHKLAQLTAQHSKKVASADLFPKQAPQRVAATPPTDTALNYGVARLNELKEQFGSGNDVRYRQRNHAPDPNDPLPQMLSGSARKENTLWLAGTALDLSDVFTLGGKSLVTHGAGAALSGGVFLTTRQGVDIARALRTIDGNSTEAQTAFRQWNTTNKGAAFTRAVEAIERQAGQLLRGFEDSLTKAAPKRNQSEASYRSGVKEAYDRLWYSMDQLYASASKHLPRSANEIHNNVDHTEAAARQLLTQTHGAAWQTLSKRLAELGVLPRYPDRAMPNQTVVLSPDNHNDHLSKLRYKQEKGDISLLPPDKQMEFKLHEINPGMFYAARQGDVKAMINVQYRYTPLVDVTDANRAERLKQVLTQQKNIQAQASASKGELDTQRGRLKALETRLRAAGSNADQDLLTELRNTRNLEVKLNRQVNELASIEHALGHAVMALEQALGAR